MSLTKDEIGQANAVKILNSGLRPVEEYEGCPYCGDEKDRSMAIGCCGESSAHFETMYRFEDDQEEASFEEWKAFDDFLNTLPDPWAEEGNSK